MEEPIFITKFEFGQVNEIHHLVKTVFDEFLAPDYSAEGVDFFYDWIKPDNFIKRQFNNSIIHLANVDSKIVGMIEVRNINRISLLFVDKKYQRQKVANTLLTVAIYLIQKQNPDYDFITVNASPYSVPFYTKMGFVETDSMQTSHGVKYMPMVRKICSVDF